jgi:HAD superfamily hydrolase (TIGR01509 family)
MVGAAMRELVIFDCDGVLVDSELIFARVLAERLRAAGFRASVGEAFELGFGNDREGLSTAVMSRFGRKLPDGFFDDLRACTGRVIERELAPMPGIGALLAALPEPRCVASNGHLERVRQRLQLTELLDFFEPHVFSATQVACGKPAPDLFLFAAQMLQAQPASCLVVEDSIAGVAAACAAGMPVVGFCGGSHCRPDHAARLRRAGCLAVFATMPDLGAFLAEEPCG